MFAGLGKTLVILGCVLLVAGGALLAAGRVPWLGRLPGDIVIRRNDFTFYFPITTCVVVSVVVSLLLRWFRG